VRTFGQATLAAGMWRIDAEPHVLMRLKRVFRRVKQQRGTVILKATDEATRDLEWFCARFPLELSEHDAKELDRRARAYDRRSEIAFEIMAGTYRLPHVEMHLPPRGYQHQAAALIQEVHGLLVADELGVGKTVTALTALAMTRAFPALIVCPVHLQLQWQRETWRFLRIPSHIARKGRPYPISDHLFHGRQPDVLIMSYSKLNGWRDVLAGKYVTVVFDECQELRRRESDKYRAAEHVAAPALYRIGLSATPIYNYGGEFWSVLNVLRPDSLGSREEFIREWCVEGHRSGKERVKNPKGFGTYLREQAVMIRRTRREVSREIPSLSRLVQRVDADPKALQSIERNARELARVILAQQDADIRNVDRMNAAGQLDTKLRQATGIAKAPYVAEFVKMLLETDEEPVVLFGWHRAVYQVWMSALAKYKPVLYTGSESPLQKDASIRQFTSGQSRLLVMSLRSGSGVDGLQAVCSRAVIGELDWSPGAIEQCIGRVHRDGQQSPVFAYYLVSALGADPVMEDVLGLKAAQIEGVRDPEGELVVAKEVDPDHIKKLARAYLQSRIARGPLSSVEESRG